MSTSLEYKHLQHLFTSFIALLVFSTYNSILVVACLVLMLLKNVTEVQVMWFGLQHFLYCRRDDRCICIVHLTALQRVIRETCVYFRDWHIFRGMGDEKRKKKKGNVIIYELRRSLLDTLKYNKHSSKRYFRHLVQKVYLKIHYKFKCLEKFNIRIKKKTRIIEKVSFN